MSSPSALAEEDEFVWAGGGNFELCVTCAIVASELAHAPTIVAVIFVCVVFSAAVGRLWTLALPLVLACAVFALMPVDRFYERTPENVQAAVVFGAMYGLGLGTAVLLVRHYVESRVERRQKSDND
jgi:K+-sensing histidine kinase KdpD